MCGFLSATAPSDARVSSFTVPARSESIDARPSIASSRSFTRFGDISPLRYVTAFPSSAALRAIASAKALLPVPTSPPSTMRSPRRSPPPRRRSSVGKPVGILSAADCPSAIASVRLSSSASRGSSWGVVISEKLRTDGEAREGRELLTTSTKKAEKGTNRILWRRTFVARVRENDFFGSARIDAKASGR